MAACLVDCAKPLAEPLPAPRLPEAFVAPDLVFPADFLAAVVFPATAFPADSDFPEEATPLVFFCADFFCKPTDDVPLSDDADCKDYRSPPMQTLSVQH